MFEKIICRVFGHKWNHQLGFEFSEKECNRCGETVELGQLIPDCYDDLLLELVGIHPFNVDAWDTNKTDWSVTLRRAGDEAYRKEFLDCAMDAVSNSLERGITPDYLFIDPTLCVSGISEFCGLKVWITPLPEDKKIVAVGLQSSASKVIE